MARRQAADYDRKRDVITTEAAKLFARKGFDGASLSDLAAACDTSKSLIYHYYPSKEAILFDVMSIHIDLLLDIVDKLKTKDAPPRELFAELSRELMRRYVGAAASQKVLLYELDNLPAPQRTEIVRKQREIVDFAEDLLKRSAPKNEHHHGRLRAQAMLFFGMLNWTHNWYKPSGPVGRDEIADMAAEAALRTLEGPGAGQ